jgi:hypothetical protein
MSTPESPPARRKIPRSVWALSGTSFFNDISSEMILNLLPLFLANSWGVVASARWADRVGKGVRTAPRDALVADSVSSSDRGLAFGLHRVTRQQARRSSRR